MSLFVYRLRFNVGKESLQSSGSMRSSNVIRRYSDPIVHPPKVTAVFCMKYATLRPIELAVMWMALRIHWDSIGTGGGGAPAGAWNRDEEVLR